MKGMVFSLKGLKRKKREKINFQTFYKKYGLVVFFALCFVVGLIFGMIGAKNADKSLLDGLDFLFTTNIENRLELSAFELFCACFSSNFLFIFASFLFGFSSWGAVAQPVLLIIRGYGVGISAGYIFSVYGLKGAGFYLLVMLLGMLLFTFSLVCECANAFSLSVRFFRLTFISTHKEPYINQGVRVYLYRSGYMLILATLASLTDTVLWILFSGVFKLT